MSEKHQKIIKAIEELVEEAYRKGIETGRTDICLALLHSKSNYLTALGEIYLKSILTGDQDDRQSS